MRMTETLAVWTYLPWRIALNSAQMRLKSGLSAGSSCQQLPTSCSSWLCDAFTPISHLRYGRNGIFSVRHRRIIISVQQHYCSSVKLMTQYTNCSLITLTTCLLSRSYMWSVKAVMFLKQCNLVQQM